MDSVVTDGICWQRVQCCSIDALHAIDCRVRPALRPQWVISWMELLGLFFGSPADHGLVDAGDRVRCLRRIADSSAATAASVRNGAVSAACV